MISQWKIGLHNPEACAHSVNILNECGQVIATVVCPDGRLAGLSLDSVGMNRATMMCLSPDMVSLLRFAAINADKFEEHDPDGVKLRWITEVHALLSEIDREKK